MEALSSGSTHHKCSLQPASCSNTSSYSSSSRTTPLFCPSVSYKRAVTTGQGHTNNAADALQLPLPGFLKDDDITEQCGFRISDLDHVPNTKLNFSSFFFLQMTRKSTHEMMCISLATKKAFLLTISIAPCPAFPVLVSRS